VKHTLESRLAALVAGLLLAAAGLGYTLARAQAGAATLLVCGLLLAAAGVCAACWAGRPLRRAVQALTGAMARYREGDFSCALRVSGDDLLGPLLAAHNGFARELREQRAALVQREMLLDAIVQQSPVAILLVDAAARVAFCNVAARRLMGAGRDMTGRRLEPLLQQGPARLREVIDAGGDTLFCLEIQGQEETFHFSQRRFSVQGLPHRLLLLRRLTRELSRQEVGTWKKLIRVLSHELNNSLAPIVSLAGSGPDLIAKGQVSGLPRLFAAIAERAGHLHAFIEGYAALARLPAPRPQALSWVEVLEGVMRQHPCRIAGSLPGEPGWFDRAQLEQVLINLLKNAHDAGGPAQEIELAVWHTPAEQRIEVRDRGSGMTDTVLRQALLPFYSTKRHGTGLGLALAREIAEAHGGRIHLANRPGGGLCVSVCLPLPSAPGGAGTFRSGSEPADRSGRAAPDHSS
jgi:two-component system, NtrC family, nitrogen regulation sensor histidine kinase NtrY